MMQSFTISLSALNVGQSPVLISVPIPNWSLLERFIVGNNLALITCPTFGLVSCPAPILRIKRFQEVLAPLSNLDFFVELSEGTEDVVGTVTGREFV